MRVIQAFALLVLIGMAGRQAFPAGSPATQSNSNRGDSAAALPKDVFLDSFSRVPLAKRDTLNDAEKKSYDALDAVDAEGRVGLRGPAGIKFHSPGLSAAERTNEFLRKTPLGGKEYELATLAVAREMNNQVMWTAHEPEAIEKGVSRDAVDAVKFRKDPGKLPERDVIIIQFVREIFQKDKVSSDTFARATRVFGTQGLVNLTAIIAYRSQNAIWGRAFDQHLNPKFKPLLPIP